MSFISRTVEKKFLSLRGKIHILEPMHPQYVIPESPDDADLLSRQGDAPYLFGNDFVNSASLPFNTTEVNDDERIPDYDDTCFLCKGTGKSQSKIGRITGKACVICGGTGQRWMG